MSNKTPKDLAAQRQACAVRRRRCAGAPAQPWSVASVHPARYARDNYAPAGLLARDPEDIPPTCPPSRADAQWHMGR